MVCGISDGTRQARHWFRRYPGRLAHMPPQLRRSTNLHSGYMPGRPRMSADDAPPQYYWARWQRKPMPVNLWASSSSPRFPFWRDARALSRLVIGATNKGHRPMICFKAAAKGVNGWGLLCAGLSAVAYSAMVIFNKLSKEITGMENAVLQLFFAAVTWCSLPAANKNR